MSTPNNRAWPLAAAALAWAMAAATAQPVSDAPDVRQMIEALRPNATRNLLVRPTAAPASEAQAAPAAPATPVAAAPAPVAPPKPPAGSAPAPPDAAPALSLALPFQPGRAQLSPDSGPVLGTLVAALLSPELRDTRFVIEGHTDASGSAAQNLHLSQQRAEEVRQYLTVFGIAPSRLRAVGKGASEPLNPANPRAAENRRVRIVVAP
jgi:outer membrane protein OmpA-like peptidoglycan-associated protein